ncbi:MAG TPA: hypothetical protein VD886_17935, partial [Herpetosiphonaceae bacterium]|nr:hypothetical protein [Herpetosiphonaceae bacterium]
GPTATLSALQPGAVYDVRVSANNSAGWHSLSTEPVRVLATNGADANGDGLPDDWQSAYRVSGGAADPDRDGLGNAAEYTAQTSPIAADTDGDGFSDFEEIHQTNPAFNTDPLASTAAPPERLQPRLVVSEDTLNFKALYGPSMPIADQAIRWSNISSGTLGLRATPEAPWITTEVTADQIVVGVDASKLSRGFYSGILRLAPTPGSDPLIEGPSCVRVNLWVATPPGGYRVYVPLLPVR